MDKRQQDLAFFVSFCIEQYKNAKHLSGKEAATVLDQYDVLDYLAEHYEMLHTQSSHWLLEDIDEFISFRRKEIS